MALKQLHQMGYESRITAKLSSVEKTTTDNYGWEKHKGGSAWDVSSQADTHSPIRARVNSSRRRPSLNSPSATSCIGTTPVGAVLRFAQPTVNNEQPKIAIAQACLTFLPLGTSGQASAAPRQALTQPTPNNKLFKKQVRQTNPVESTPYLLMNYQSYPSTR